jgi:hypothetical protein
MEPPPTEDDSLLVLTDDVEPEHGGFSFLDADSVRSATSAPSV